MVSGFLISPYDQDRIFSGEAIEIRIWSKTWAGVVGLKRFIISWFMVFSICQLAPAEFLSSVMPRDGGPQIHHRRGIAQAMTAARAAHAPPYSDYSAASDVAAGPILELCRSTLRPSERISLTSTLNDSGIPASNVSSPRTIASYTLVRPATSSDFTVSISCSV